MPTESTAANVTQMSEPAAEPRRPAPAAEPARAKPVADAAAKVQKAAATDVSDFFAAGRAQIEQTFASVNGRMDVLREATRDAGAAVQESQTQVIAGLRDISDAALNGAQSALDRYFNLVRSATEAKSLSDLLEIQSSYIREAFAARTEEQRALREIATETTKAAIEPLKASFTEAMAKVKSVK